MTTGHQPSPQLQKSAFPSESAVRIFTMPERYRHGVEARVHEPERMAPVSPTAEFTTPKIPPASAPVAPQRPPLAKKRTSLTKKILLIGGAIILFLVVGGYMVIQTMERPEDTTSRVSTTPLPPQPVEPQTTSEEEEGDEEGSSQEEVGENLVEVFPTQVLPGVDTDSDGLTDAEEQLLYQTDPKRPDTDADGFLDGNEVFHRYNPGGIAPSTLLDSGLVQIVSGTAADSSYTFYYPAVWKMESQGAEFVIDTGTGEGFRISLLEKEKDQSFETWVDVSLGLSDAIKGVTKNGLTFAQSEDQLTVYLDLRLVVMVFTYDTGIQARVDYLQTFKMMLNSVSIVEEAQTSL